MREWFAGRRNVDNHSAAESWILHKKVRLALVQGGVPLSGLHYLVSRKQWHLCCTTRRKVDMAAKGRNWSVGPSGIAMLNVKELEAFLEDLIGVWIRLPRSDSVCSHLVKQLGKTADSSAESGKTFKETRDIRTREKYGREGIEASGD